MNENEATLFTGRVESVETYEYALTAYEVEEIYNGRRPQAPEGEKENAQEESSKEARTGRETGDA